MATAVGVLRAVPGRFVATLRTRLGLLLGLAGWSGGKPPEIGPSPPTPSSSRGLPIRVCHPRRAWGFAVPAEWAASLRPRPPRAGGSGAPALWGFLVQPRWGLPSPLQSGEPCAGQRSPDGELRPGDAIRLPAPALSLGDWKGWGDRCTQTPLPGRIWRWPGPPLRKDNSVGTRLLHPFCLFFWNFLWRLGWRKGSQSLEKFEYRFQEVGCEPRLLLKIAPSHPPPQALFKFGGFGWGALAALVFLVPCKASWRLKSFEHSYSSGSGHLKAKPASAWHQSVTLRNHQCPPRRSSWRPVPESRAGEWRSGVGGGGRPLQTNLSASCHSGPPWIFNFAPFN